MCLHICIYMLLCLYTYWHMLFMYTLIYVFIFLYLYIYMCVHVCLYIHVVIYRHVCIFMLTCFIFLHMLCSGKEIGLLHPLLLSSLVLQLVLVCLSFTVHPDISPAKDLLFQVSFFGISNISTRPTDDSVSGLFSSFRFSLAPSLLLFISLLLSYPYPRWIYV